MRKREQDLFDFLNTMDNEEISEKPLFFRPNFAHNQIEIESQPMTQALSQKLQPKYQREEQIDLKLN